MRIARVARLSRTKTRGQRFAVLLAAAVVAVLVGCAGQRAEPRLTPPEQQLNVESFDVVWQTVRDTHWDPDLGGVDWNAVRGELRPRVAQATTMSAARQATRDAIGRLKQSHFGIIPRDAYIDGRSPEAGATDGQTGLVPRVIDEQAVVWKVRPGSSAAEQGVRPGWLLTRIGKEDLAAALRPVAAAHDGSTLAPISLVRAVESRLEGPVGEMVTVGLRDGADRRVRCALQRMVPAGKRVVLGNLPAMYLEFESRELPGRVAYIAFNVFMDPQTLMSQFEAAVTAALDAKGIILDLRGNAGGIGAMAMGMAGWFITDPGQPLGTMHTRGTDLIFAVFPRPQTYGGPLAVLVDGCTASTAEILAGGLQDLGRARIFGSRTAGAALPAITVKLPNGDGFLHAVADYVSASGRRLEGAGVIPDEEVPLTRAALLAGPDAVLDAAADWIRRQPERNSDDTTARPDGAAE